MMKLALVLPGWLMAAGALAATPVHLTDAQMDQVTAGVAPSPTGFVCPVIETDNVLHSPKSGTLGPIDGDDGQVYYTIGGPDVPVPMHATNDDGAGSPGGPYTAPGNPVYTAIWYTE